MGRSASLPKCANRNMEESARANHESSDSGCERGDASALKTLIRGRGKPTIWVIGRTNYGITHTLPEGSTVVIITDSKYLQSGMTEWIARWKRSGWRTRSGPVKNRDLWQRLDALCAARSVTFSWVRGHAGDPGNERADRAAQRCAARARALVDNHPEPKTTH